MSDSNTVSYANVVAETNLLYSQPVEKLVPTKPPQQPGSGGKYHEIPLQYKYGDRVSDFLMEWPELYSNGGLNEKPGPTGRPEQSIMVSLPPKDETKVLADKINAIHKACCQIIGKCKGAVKMFDFDPNAPGQSFKNPIYKSRDKVTGEIIEGRDSAFFLKCFKRGYGATEEKTLFHRPVKVMKDGKEVIQYETIPWELVKGVELRFIPLVHVKKIYVGGGKASLQMEVVSAVVTYLAGKGSTSKQMATIESLVGKNPNIVSSLEEQIAKLTMTRQSQIEVATQQKPVAPQGQGQGQPQGQNQWQGQGQPQGQNQWQGQGQPQGQNQWQGQGQSQPQPQGQNQWQPQGQGQGQGQFHSQDSSPNPGTMSSISGGPAPVINTNYVQTPAGPASTASMADFLNSAPAVNLAGHGGIAPPAIPASFSLKTPALKIN